jgi:hypothetical protein
MQLALQLAQEFLQLAVQQELVSQRQQGQPVLEGE